MTSLTHALCILILPQPSRLLETFSWQGGQQEPEVLVNGRDELMFPSPGPTPLALPPRLLPQTSPGSPCRVLGGRRMYSGCPWADRASGGGSSSSSSSTASSMVSRSRGANPQGPPCGACLPRCLSVLATGFSSLKPSDPILSHQSYPLASAVPHLALSSWSPQGSAAWGAI